MSSSAFKKYTRSMVGTLDWSRPSRRIQLPVRLPKSPRILILTASTGGGHISAAKALEQELEKRSVEFINVDTLDLTTPLFQLVYRGGYELMVKHFPKAYGMFYHLVEQWDIAERFWTNVERLFVSRLSVLINDYQPDIIICTHALPLPQIASLRGAKDKPWVAVVITDMYPHPMWLRGGPNQVFVPSQWSQNIIEQRHMAASERIIISGIPIAPYFAKKEDICTPETWRDLNPNLPTIIVSSGTIGGGRIAEAVKALATMHTECQVVVLCGRNPIVYEHVSALLRRRKDPGHVQFHVRLHVSQSEMAHLMRHCEIIVGKPGGLTVSEALASGCPYIVYGPFLIPGQEEGNSEFMVHNGAGIRVDSARQLPISVEKLLASPEKRAEMRQNALRLSNPEAAQDIVQILLSTYVCSASAEVP